MNLSKLAFHQRAKLSKLAVDSDGEYHKLRCHTRFLYSNWPQSDEKFSYLLTCPGCEGS